MNIFDDYTLSLLTELNNNEVQYIVVGGYAVNYYGYKRTTGDIDLWIKPENDINKKNIIKSLRKLKVEEEILIQLNELDFTTHIVFIDGEEPFKIDFMTYVSGVEFNEAWQQKLTIELDGLSIHFIHLNHLIISKITSGREKDKIDIETLQKIKSMRKK